MSVGPPFHDVFFLTFHLPWSAEVVASWVRLIRVVLVLYISLFSPSVIFLFPDHSVVWLLFGVKALTCFFETVNPRSSSFHFSLFPAAH